MDTPSLWRKAVNASTTGSRLISLKDTNAGITASQEPDAFWKAGASNKTTLSRISRVGPNKRRRIDVGIEYVCRKKIGDIKRRIGTSIAKVTDIGRVDISKGYKDIMREVRLDQQSQGKLGGSTHDRICRPVVVAWPDILKLTVIDVAMVSLWLSFHCHSVGFTLHQADFV
jgi:uncharacterized protein YcbK (DUF882 family)